jgi:hypothetical protein
MFVAIRWAVRARAERGGGFETTRTTRRRPSARSRQPLFLEVTWETAEMVVAGPIRYVMSDVLQIAYQVVGSGPVDVVYVPGLANHIESMWDIPEIARSRNGWRRTPD